MSYLMSSHCPMCRLKNTCSSDTITSRKVLDNLTETIAPTTITAVDTQYDSEDNHSDNNDGQDVEVMSGDDQGIDNSTHSTLVNTSVMAPMKCKCPMYNWKLTSQIGLTLSILILWKLL
ncbi:hypothetical protein R3W88_004389 [Solanum pinnatisectum]|uniref:Uncharacterized protein n=1 Tax=Solanum pinnatisectum TaxID=50273 RepID=A0AAV9K964_9SOLN|nr:hypothetical protein R3W88_004389 [Solanum pinnatisectum]